MSILKETIKRPGKITVLFGCEEAKLQQPRVLILGQDNGTQLEYLSC